MILKQGYIQVYTGDGKGKTTASLGVALRVLGNGGKVYYAQFIKGKKISSEFTALRIFNENFVHKAYGKGRFIINGPDNEDKELAKKGLEECSGILSSGKYDLVVMDELNVALKIGLVDLKNVLEAVKSKHPQTELIITGRYAKNEITELADLVTEMKMIRHYYKKGVPARKGIEL